MLTILKDVVELGRKDGLPALKRKIRQRLSPSLWTQYSGLASWHIAQYDFTEEELTASRAVHTAHTGFLDICSITWFLPQFTNPFFGGIMTILRFANHFKLNANIKNHFVIAGTDDPQPYREMIMRAFPGLADESVETALSTKDVAKLSSTDAAIATYWTTAYYQLLFNQTHRKFNFVQDYEPLFYPAGASSAQIQATYRFGYYGIGNTQSISDLYAHGSGCPSEYFVPSVDTTLFYPPTDPVSRPSEPFWLFFYGRPENTRNAFELGVAALKQLKQRMGSRVRILAAGHSWHAADYGLKGVIENLGLLPYEETAALYRKCSVGLAMMATPHPSYLPLEFMASGCLAVGIYNSGTAWFYRHGENCLISEASATCLADTLERALCREAERHVMTQNALADIAANYSDWTPQINKIYRFLREPKVAL